MSLELNLVDEKQIATRLGVSLSTVRRLRMRDSAFPPAIFVTDDCIRYDAAAVADWVKSRTTERKPGAKR